MLDPTQDNPSAVKLESSWRDSLKDESLKSSKSLEKFKDIEPLAKAYTELEGKLGRSIELPKDEADAESWNKLYDRLGRPKTPEEYELAAIEDEGFKKALVERGYRNGLTKKQLSEMASAFKERDDATKKASEESRAKALSAAEAKLRAKYGDKFADVPEKASKAFTKMFAGRTELYARLKAAGFDNDPDFVDVFAEYHDALAPDDNPVMGDKGGKSASREPDMSWMYEKYGGAPTPGRT